MEHAHQAHRSMNAHALMWYVQVSMRIVSACVAVFLTGCPQGGVSCGRGTHLEGVVCVADESDGPFLDGGDPQKGTTEDGGSPDGGGPNAMCGQGGTPVQSRPFYIEASERCIPQSMEELSDGAMAVLSACPGNVGANVSIILPDGRVQESVTYGTDGASLTIPVGVVELRNCSLAIVSNAIDGNGNARLQLTTLTRGNGITGSNTYLVAGSSSTSASQVRARPLDGGVAVLVGGFWNNARRQAIVEFDTEVRLERVIEWTRQDASSPIASFAYSAEEKLIVAGSRNGLVEGTSTPDDAWASLMSRNGEVIWSKQFLLEGRQEASAIEATPEGFVLVAQHEQAHDARVFILKHDGSVARALTLGGNKDDLLAANVALGQNLHVAKDGSFGLAMASRSFGTDASPAWLVARFLASGELKWAKALGGDSFGRPIAIRITADNNVVVSGQFALGDTGYDRLGFLRLGGEGESSVCSQVRAVAPTSLELQVTSQDISAPVRKELPVLTPVGVANSTRVSGSAWTSCP